MTVDRIHNSPIECDIYDEVDEFLSNWRQSFVDNEGNKIDMSQLENREQIYAKAQKNAWKTEGNVLVLTLENVFQRLNRNTTPFQIVIPADSQLINNDEALLKHIDLCLGECPMFEVLGYSEFSVGIKTGPNIASVYTCQMRETDFINRLIYTKLLIDDGSMASSIAKPIIASTHTITSELINGDMLTIDDEKHPDHYKFILSMMNIRASLISSGMWHNSRVHIDQKPQNFRIVNGSRKNFDPVC